MSKKIEVGDVVDLWPGSSSAIPWVVTDAEKFNDNPRFVTLHGGKDGVGCYERDKVTFVRKATASERAAAGLGAGRPTLPEWVLVTRGVASGDPAVRRVLRWNDGKPVVESKYDDEGWQVEGGNWMPCPAPTPPVAGPSEAMLARAEALQRQCSPSDYSAWTTQIMAEFAQAEVSAERARADRAERSVAGWEADARREHLNASDARARAEKAESEVATYRREFNVGDLRFRAEKAEAALAAEKQACERYIAERDEARARVRVLSGGLGSPTHSLQEAVNAAVIEWVKVWGEGVGGPALAAARERLLSAAKAVRP